MPDEQKPIVKVCTHDHCLSRGSEEIFEKLQAELHGEALVLRSPECLDHCERGANLSVNGNILHDVTPENATHRVHQELKHPSLKSDGAGTKSLTELDRVLNDLTQL